MRKLSIALLIALLGLTLLPALHTAAAGRIVRITLIDENGSGEDGSGQLTDMLDGTTKVELIMLNSPDGAIQPAQIHTGTCAVLDPDTAYDLTNVVAGKSTTIVKVDLDVLTGAKYAIAVNKSPTEASSVISCGILPVATTTTGPLTVAQVLDQLLSAATDLQATVKKHETDASEAAFNAYHTLFAANENTIKDKNAATQASLDDVMTALGGEIASGDWTKAEGDAQELVDQLTEAKAALGGTTAPAPAADALSTALTQLQSAANDLIRETTNEDTAGAQAAYNAYHDLFAANETDIAAKNADAQAALETAMHDVRDALAAGDWAKAQTAAKELLQEVNNTMTEMGMTTSLPTSGNGSLPLVLWTVAAAALAVLLTGVGIRRRNVR